MFRWILFNTVSFALSSHLKLQPAFREQYITISNYDELALLQSFIGKILSLSKSIKFRFSKFK